MKLREIPENGTIGIVAPAFPPESNKLESGIAYLENLGYKIKRGKTLGGRHGYFAGNDQLRAGDLNEMYSDPNVDAIICARGGWGSLRILDLLDYELIRDNPKLLIGYSDITTLQLAIWKNCRVPSLSGPMAAVEMGKGIHRFTEKYFLDQISGNHSGIIIDLPGVNAEIRGEEDRSGILLGGCLSLVTSLLGTKYEPDFNKVILVLEDIAEEPYKIDRHLAQLKQAGVFEKIGGLILGDFIDCEPKKDDQHAFTVNEIFSDYFSGKTFPVISGFPYGHGDKKISMPIGIPVTISASSRFLKIGNLFTPESV
ncbi:MAG: LD-carboxypeptidase [Calditrichaceae bacterium]